MFGNVEASNVLTDKDKKEKLERLGYSHVQIPHWWDGKRKSLISFVSPDFFFSFFLFLLFP